MKARAGAARAKLLRPSLRRALVVQLRVAGIKLSRQTRVPDFSGNLTNVTAYYWVAKGVGMIRGQGIFRILNIDDVVYELTDTNLSQQ